jgi:uncharacterized membrane protein
MLYYLLKTIHILSSTLLFGTGLGSAFYFYRAQQSRDIHALYFTAKNVVLADWCFTTPAVIIQPLTGFWLIHLMHYSFSSPWIVWALILYVFVGLCWLPVVYYQIKMFELIKKAKATQTPLPDKYTQYERRWFLLGWPAFIAVIIIFYLMTAKPG